MTFHFKLSKKNIEGIKIITNSKISPVNTAYITVGKNTVTFTNFVSSISFVTDIEGEPDFGSCYEFSSSFWKKLSMAIRDYAKVTVEDRKVIAKGENFSIEGEFITGPFDKDIETDAKKKGQKLFVKDLEDIVKLAQPIISSTPIHKPKLLVFYDDLLIATNWLSVIGIFRSPINGSYTLDFESFVNILNLSRSIELFNSIELYLDDMMATGKTETNSCFFTKLLSVDIEGVPMDCLNQLVEDYLRPSASHSTIHTHISRNEIIKAISPIERYEKFIFTANERIRIETIETKSIYKSEIGSIKNQGKFSCGFTKEFFNLCIPDSKEIKIEYFEPSKPLLFRPYPARGEAYIVSPLITNK